VNGCNRKKNRLAPPEKRTAESSISYFKKKLPSQTLMPMGYNYRGGENIIVL